jgi:hypothetical protein
MALFEDFLFRFGRFSAIEDCIRMPFQGIGQSSDRTRRFRHIMKRLA